MNENQKMKLELLREFEHVDNPVGFCREAYKFLTEDEVKTVPICSSLKEGIYLVYHDGHSVPFVDDMPKLTAQGVTGIGVVYDGHAFQVALEDLGEQILLSESKCGKLPEESPFYKTESEGVHDWDFVSATNHLIEEGMDIPLPEGWYIPTLSPLTLMCWWKEKINKALVFAGGKPMPDDFHWSSTEYGRNSARYVYFLNGNTYYFNKFYSNVVRAVTAFNPVP